MPGQVDRAGQEIAGQYQPFLAQLSQINIGLPCRTNLVDLGYTGLTDGALAATGVAVFVPVRVVPGDIISTVSIPIGGTGAGTPTHSFAALYEGLGTEPKLLGQSKDGLTAAIAASKLFTFTLEKTVEITKANAPNGFIYVAISVTATTVPTAAVGATPTGINYQWISGGPQFLSATAGSALNGTAAEPSGALSAKAVAPVVILR